MKEHFERITDLDAEFASRVEGFFTDGKAPFFAVGVSGGIDSMALVLLAKKWADDKGGKVVAITVDHDLRKESGKEALQVAKWLQEGGVEHHILKWHGLKPSSNIQAEARDARYQLMSDFCKARKIDSLLIAHNLEDQAETVLQRIMRGSGVDGLSGIPEVRHSGKFRVIRPLLSISKSDLTNYLQDNNQPWIDDPSNENTKFLRVNVRNFIKNSEDPELLVRRLAETAENMMRSRSLIDEVVNRSMSLVVTFKPEGYCYIDLKKFKEQHEEVCYKILARILTSVGGKYYKPRFENLKRLFAGINEVNFKGCTLWGCSIKPCFGSKIMITRELSAISEEIDAVSGREVVWDNRFKCIYNGPDKDGLKIGAIGEEGFAKLCEENRGMADIMLPKQIVFSLPALKCGKKILSIPQLGFYSEEIYKEFSVNFLLKINS